MILSGVVIAGVAGAGTFEVVKYREQKRKREYPWTVRAEKMGLIPISQDLKGASRGIFGSKRNGTGQGEGSGNKQPVTAVQPVEVPAGLSSFVSNLQIYCRECTDKLMAPYVSQTRREQLAEITTGKEALEMSEAEKKARRGVLLGSSSFLLAVGGSLFYAPLYVPSVAIMAYVFKDWPKKAYKALVEERRVGIEMILAVSLPGVVLSGFIVAGALGLWYLAVMRLVLAKSENHSRNSLVNLFGQQPRFVWLLVDSADGEGQEEVEVPFESVKAGDLVAVMAGQTIPVDGTITSGIASIDQRMLTGEAQPAQKGVEDSVFAGTIVLSGKIIVRVCEAGEQTLIAQIGEILNHTEDFDQSIRSRVSTLQDKVVPPLFVLAGASLPWLGLNGALAILWYSPGARMLMFGPMSMLNFLHICSQKRVLIKDGRSLELLSDIDTVVFDKTGTLTIEQPTVSRITTLRALSEEQLLIYAAAAEYKQSHPIAKAILTAAAERQLDVPTIDDAHYEIGYGVKVRLDGEASKTIRVGSKRFMALEGIKIPASICAQQAACHAHGYSLVMVAIDAELSGTIELRPTIRREAKEVVRHLQAAGKSVTIISGDHEMPTRQLAEELGIEQYFANTLPENKADLVVQLQQEGRSVCFVGDGINDAIALKKANVSISLRGATTVATDSAQIVLMDENLAQLTDLFEIAQEFKTNIDRSFLTTIVPNMLGVAGTVFFHWGYITAVALSCALWFPQLAVVMQPLYKHRPTIAEDGEKES